MYARINTSSRDYRIQCQVRQEIRGREYRDMIPAAIIHFTSTPVFSRQPWCSANQGPRGGSGEQARSGAHADNKITLDLELESYDPGCDPKLQQLAFLIRSPSDIQQDRSSRQNAVLRLASRLSELPI